MAGTVRPAIVVATAGDTGSAPALAVQGDWVLANASDIAGELERLPPTPAMSRIESSRLSALDTAGAGLLMELADRVGGRAAIEFIGLRDVHRNLLELVRERAFEPGAHIKEPYHHGLVWTLGRAAAQIEPLIESQVRYLGYVATLVAQAAIRPARMRWREFLIQCEHAGLDAIPVVVLITFLIGVVLAYLLGLQAAQYGANVFVIDGVALGMVREFSPLLVAIIIAGRSGAAFTAQLGTMRLTQETDAIAMMGLSPGQVLVVPRVLALVVTMPLLVFVGDLAGLVGASVICRLMLDLPYETFVERIHSSLDARHVVIGIGKTPVFALAIATIACRLGMTAERDTRSIGIATTSTVVQAIVTVIVIDAAFAVAFQLGKL
jgi:phospholipid/cholesterol/gamma-HCH transport system permease protein